MQLLSVENLPGMCKPQALTLRAERRVPNVLVIILKRAFKPKLPKTQFMK